MQGFLDILDQIHLRNIHAAIEGLHKRVSKSLVISTVTNSHVMITPVARAIRALMIMGTGDWKPAYGRGSSTRIWRSSAAIGKPRAADKRLEGAKGHVNKRTTGERKWPITCPTYKPSTRPSLGGKPLMASLVAHHVVGSTLKPGQDAQQNQSKIA